MKLPGSSHVITPIFATYNVLLKRVVLCYPDFDQPVKDWLPKHKVAAAEHTLPTIWNSLIRTVLDNITDTKVLKLGRFEDISSYIWDSRSKELKLILFPLEENERDDSYSTRFASFLRLNLYDHWPHPDLDSFIQALESAQDDPLKLQLITHPLIEDMDALSVLIRTTWRLLKDLTSLQQSTMDATIDHTKWGNNKSWQGFQYFDDVLNSMLGGSRRSNDAAGLFCFVKEVCAHYTENHRKRYLNRRGYHPVWIIKKCFPGLILAIYKLNLDPNWLKS
uniref:Uncharacterized protein n=1 Tax=Arundo donax TaxID=35708 RepID=A0A0A9GXA3_ARUDO